MKTWRDQRGVAFILEIILVAIIIAVVAAVVLKVRSKQPANHASTTKSGLSYDKTASNQLTNGKCDGVGSVPITAPMPINQIGSIQPYGLMVGGHVTPVDHQYYLGPNPQALRDTYDVVAPADGWLVQIQHRGNQFNTPPHTVDQPSSDEYRLVFAHTCSFLTYVDLVTSLSDEVKAQIPNYDPHTDKGFTPFKVKKGEVIGHIGGQTLDFAVWDLSQKPLPFIVRTAYDNAEAWKVFTAPTTKFLDPSVKASVISKYVRTVDPIDGQVSYDQDGKLVGTWFKVGTNGYLGSSDQSHRSGYWAGHLSFAPNYIDPTMQVISVGNYPGVLSGGAQGNPAGANAQQFGIKANAPDPATVSSASGAVKYELVTQMLVTADGQHWDGQFAHGIKAQNQSQVVGTMLVQILSNRSLKVEIFPGKTATQVSGFDSGATLYNRGDDAKLPPSTAY